MNKSKYNPKLDPKYNSTQPTDVPASAQVSTTAPTVYKIHEALPADNKVRVDRSVEAVVSPEAKSSAAMVNEGGPAPITAVPSKSKAGEKAPALSAKPLA
jgi:hypothetical protein